jgi:hypothetical protein
MTLLNSLEARGIEFSTDHGYQPHITLKKVSKSEVIEIPTGDNFSFPLNKVTLIWRNDEENRDTDPGMRIDYSHIGDIIMTKSNGKAGARNNRMDSRNIQDIHDMSCKLGAMCDKANTEDEEEKTWKSMLWSEMSFDQRRKAIADAFYEQVSFSGIDEWDFWVQEVFDDYFLVHYDNVVWKFEYTVLNDKELVIAREGQPGTMEWMPIPPDNNYLRSVGTFTAAQAKKAIQLSLKTGLQTANQLKTIELTDEEWKVGNYMVLWDGRDLTGEHFTKNTVFESEYTKTDTLIEDWEHGLWPDKVGPKSDEPLGRVLYKATAQSDDIGLFVERVLNRQNKYLEALRQLQEEGIISLGTSSEAVPSLVEKSKDGEIIQWGLKADALTVTPAEPRMLTINELASVKNMGEDVLNFLKSVLCDQCAIGEDERSSYVQRLKLKKKTLTLHQ